MTAPGTSTGAPGPDGSRVLLYTRPGCHLCDDARAVVARVCAQAGTGYDEVDISGSAELTDAYGEQIPVTFVDGRQHDFWHVDEERLRRALDRGLPGGG